ncbi:hypothetical protein ATX60_10010 [Oenococcus oeni]|nr:hypothetical protein ATX60_10010 [Oenococcus oeni]
MYLFKNVFNLFLGSIIGAWINNRFAKKQAKKDEVKDLEKVRPIISVAPAIHTTKEKKTEIKFAPARGSEDILLKNMNVYFDLKFNRFKASLSGDVTGIICHQQLDNFNKNSVQISASENYSSDNTLNFRFLITAETELDEKILIYHFNGQNNYYFFEPRKFLEGAYDKLNQTVYQSVNNKNRSNLASKINEFDDLIKKGKSQDSLVQLTSNGNLLDIQVVTGDTTVRPK